MRIDVNPEMEQTRLWSPRIPLLDYKLGHLNKWAGSVTRTLTPGDAVSTIMIGLNGELSASPVYVAQFAHTS